MLNPRAGVRRLLVPLLTLFLALTAALAGGTLAPAQAAEPGTGQVDVVLTSHDGGALDGQVLYYKWNAATAEFDIQTGLDVAGPSPVTTTASVPVGDYYVYYASYTQDDGYALSSGGTLPPRTVDEPGVFRVGEDTSQRIDMYVPPAQTFPVPVTGTLVDEQGRPLANLRLRATPSDFDFATSTRADGSFYNEAYPGPATLRIDGGEDFLDQVITLDVPRSGLELAPITMVRAKRFSLGGTVVQADGQVAPAPGAVARLFQGFDNDVDGVIDFYAYMTEERVGPDGSYSFPDLREGRTFTVSGIAAGHARTYLGGATDLASASKVVLTGNTVNPVIRMNLASTVSGVVSGPSGPASGVEVGLWRWEPSEESFYEESTTVARADGSYDFSIEEAGSYTLRFDGTQVDPPYRSTWLEGTERPRSTDAPGVFTIGGERQQLVRDKTLERGPAVRGTVTGPNGPERFVRVVLHRYDAVGETFTPVSTDVTDASGRYGFSPAQDGTYALFFDVTSNGGVKSEWLAGTEMPAGPGAPGTFVVDSSTTAVVRDKQLPRVDGVIGRVVDSAGKPVSGVEVTIYHDYDTFSYEDVDGEWYPTYVEVTDADGRYAAPVPAGWLVTVGYSRENYLPTFLGGGSQLPAVPDATNSRTTPEVGDTVLPDVALEVDPADPPPVEPPVVTPPVTPPGEPAPVAPTATTVPAITGSPQVGKVLTATSGTWSASGLTYAYQWLREGQPVAGATGASYEVVPGDVGRALSVRVTATTPSNPATPAGTAVSAPVIGLLGDAPTATAVPAVTGTPQLGETLAATTGTWSAEGLTFAYQWRRDGAAIAGATAATYELVTADAGRQVAVAVTASRAGYADGSSSSASVTVLRSAACTTALRALVRADDAVDDATADVRSAATRVATLRERIAQAREDGLRARVAKLKVRLEAAKDTLSEARDDRAAALTRQDRAEAAVVRAC